MATRPREEISFEDLQRVLDAAHLLRKYNLIHVVHIRAIRETLHRDVDTIATRHEGRLTLEQIKTLSALWDATRPLGEDDSGVDLANLPTV
jgi:hypothetical protein